MPARNEAEISKNDESVLHMIFNPNLPLQTDEDGSKIDSDKNMESQFDQELLNEVKKIEIKGVKCAEENDLDGAIGFFNEAIAKMPDYAAAYNNRAQARRMNKDKAGAYEDIDKAISLSNGKTASLAYTQRALLRKLDGDTEGSLEDFKKAADLGNSFAKQQVVEANPYAAMCNKMLHDVIGKLRRGETD